MITKTTGLKNILLTVTYHRNLFVSPFPSVEKPILNYCCRTGWGAPKPLPPRHIWEHCAFAGNHSEHHATGVAITGQATLFAKGEKHWWTKSKSNFRHRCLNWLTFVFFVPSLTLPQHDCLFLGTFQRYLPTTAPTLSLSMALLNLADLTPEGNIPQTLESLRKNFFFEGLRMFGISPSLRGVLCHVDCWSLFSYLGAIAFIACWVFESYCRRQGNLCRLHFYMTTNPPGRNFHNGSNYPVKLFCISPKRLHKKRDQHPERERMLNHVIWCVT